MIENKQPIVFISHASKDKETFVKSFAAKLKEQGFKVWFDQEDIRPGDIIPDAIARGIENCQVFIVVLSSNSIDNSWVLKELNLASTHRVEKDIRKIIPIIIDEYIEVPGILKDTAPVRINNLNDYAEEFNKIVGAIFEISNESVPGKYSDYPTDDIKTETLAEANLLVLKMLGNILYNSDKNLSSVKNKTIFDTCQDYDLSHDDISKSLQTLAQKSYINMKGKKASIQMKYSSMTPKGFVKYFQNFKEQISRDKYLFNPKQIFEKRSAEIREVSRIRQSLTNWSLTIPHHTIKDFGEKINIVEAEVYGVYLTTLKSTYETRSLKKRKRPNYGNKDFPPVTVKIPDIDIWEYTYPLCTELFIFKDESPRIHEIAGTHNVSSCTYCKGGRNVSCDVCGGKAEISCKKCKNGLKRCKKCNGRGNLNCSHCGGKGYYFDEITQKRKKCPECDNSSGKISCPDCNNGYLECEICSGTGKLICPECEGAGKIPCEICDSTGEMVDHLYILQEFKTIYHEDWTADDDLYIDVIKKEVFKKNTAKKKQKKILASKGKVVKSIENVKIPGQPFDSLPNEKLKNIILKLLKKSRREIDQSRDRFIAQQLQVESFNLFGLNYKAREEEKIDNAFLFGNGKKNLKVFSDDNIFFRKAKKLFGEARKLFSNQKFWESKQRSLKALEMFEALGKKREMAKAQTLNKDSEKKIDGTISFTGIVVGIAFAILHFFTALIGHGLADAASRYLFLFIYPIAGGGVGGFFLGGCIINEALDLRTPIGWRLLGGILSFIICLIIFIFIFFKSPDLFFLK